jgi:hypothetical protein
MKTEGGPMHQISRSPLYGMLRQQYFHAIRPGVDHVLWWLDPKHWRSFQRLHALRDKHIGQRCFIIGNGPSLGRMDLSPLQHEVTFGLNRIYLLFPKLGFPTSYFVSVNRLVIEQCAEDIQQLPMPKFISWHARHAIDFTSDMIFVRDPYDGVAEFSTRPAHHIWEGATVTYVAMQVAYYLGFQTVILIGVDHSFATKGQPHKVVVSTGPDPNHFDASYFGKGFRWQLPDLETSEQAYRLARQTFAQDGREVLDATVGGKLRIFPKVDYQTLFRE